MSEDIDQTARAIYAARGAHEPSGAWRPWEDLDDAARDVWRRCAAAAFQLKSETAPPGGEVGFDEAVAAERDAWISELRPLIAAGAFEGVTLTACEQCGALLTDDEIAPANDWKGCWRSATGGDKDPCPGTTRERLTALLSGNG